jgi:hypothetical protein
MFGDWLQLLVVSLTFWLPPVTLGISSGGISLSKLSWRPEDLGVHHLIIPGVLPVPSTGKQPPSSESVQLHVFITAKHSRTDKAEAGGNGNVTLVRGYFFAESLSKYRFTPWGQPSQSWAVMKWRYPVTLRDLVSGQAHAVRLQTAIWAKGKRDKLHYPMLFEATLPDHVHCIEVGAYVHCVHSMRVNICAKRMLRIN